MLRLQTAEMNVICDMTSVMRHVAQIQLSNAKTHVMGRWLMNCVYYQIILNNGHGHHALGRKEIVSGIDGAQSKYYLDEIQITHLSLVWLCNDRTFNVDYLCLLARIFLLFGNTAGFGGYAGYVRIVAAENDSFCLAYSLLVVVGIIVGQWWVILWGFAFLCWSVNGFA